MRVTRGHARSPQLRQFLLLIRRQDLIDFRHRLASNRGQLAHFAAFGLRQLLNLRNIIGLDRGPERLPGLPQFLANLLPGLPGVLEDRLLLRLLSRRQVQISGKERTPPIVPVNTGR